MKLIDLSVVIDENTPAYPGDPKIKIETIPVNKITIGLPKNKLLFVGGLITNQNPATTKPIEPINIRINFTHHIYTGYSHRFLGF